MDLTPPASASADSKDSPRSISPAPAQDRNRSPQSPQRSPIPKLPSLRTTGDAQHVSPMTASSSPLGNINAARGQTGSPRGAPLAQDVQARMKAFHQSRQRPPPGHPIGSSVGVDRTGPTSEIPALAQSLQNMPLSPGPGPPTLNSPGGFLPTAKARPMPPTLNSNKAKPNIALNPAKGLAAKRGLNMGMKLSDATGPPPALKNDNPLQQDKDKPSEVKVNGGPDSLFDKYAKYVDTKTGTLNFKDKAVIHGHGIDFSSGSSFNISLDEVDTLDELGKGNYGTVYKVRHSRPKMRKPGQGLGGNRAPASLAVSEIKTENAVSTNPQSNSAGSSTTGIVMGMKEIRLELDDAKFAAIIMELDVLHRCVSPYIVDFYGAFFQEGAVYICMEFMDGGSVDKLYGDGVPESVLRKITLATTLGLKSLKDEHNIIHRDVKPTNILVNTKGQVKICDFGVSGNLVASIAKTNIGCQSYMAPERISGGGVAQAGANPGGGTYSVQSDIWSLGLSIIECGMGQYPYPPETYDNIFSQLSAIVDGEPPDLPADGFSESARDFVRGALNKIPKLRPTYAMLLAHPWLSELLKPATIVEEEEEEDDEQHQVDHDAPRESPEIPGVVDSEVSKWVLSALNRKAALGKDKVQKTPALHAAPLSS